ncbi:hypothetical protein [Polymorphospora rubra]|uniref:Beta-ketoacyl-[acyl-carrier-protein] synthase III N-terminal domain-containing protein n=1 Tax=Polymorphospora rubra TaxID=338584 RepID=A0A810N3H7_9ACTN|nr:hypothetical protein [Polymorphospora rubra]BCJ68241.1 hypothetical protein Prubr_52620 [Polymorphospora rubra]
MAHIHLSSISYVHGGPRPLAGLGEPGCDDELLTRDGLGSYRETTASSLEMACDVGAKTLAAAGVTPDFVLYATETPQQGETALATNADLAVALGVPGAVVLNLAGHGCGNLGLLVQVADALLSRHRAGSALLVTADQARGRPRMMTGPLSVLSDGAAAVLATREAPAAGPALRVHGVAVRADAQGGAADVSPAGQRRTVLLGRSAAAGLKDVSGLGPRDYTHALFNNYRLSSQRFLAGAAGFAAAQLLPGPVGEYGHGFAADLLVNCALFFRAGAFEPGARLALSATGPNSWALIDVEVAG